MKNENYYRSVFKKQHDCLIGTGDSISIAMTEDRFIDVLNKLNLLTIPVVINSVCPICGEIFKKGTRHGNFCSYDCWDTYM